MNKNLKLKTFFFLFQLQNERRRLEREVEEIRRQKEDQWKENERLKSELDSLR
jgi:hypothetical protein